MSLSEAYFPTPLQISAEAWQQLELAELLSERYLGAFHDQAQLAALRLRERRGLAHASGGQLQLLGLLNETMRSLLAGLEVARPDPGEGSLAAFFELFPDAQRLRGQSGVAVTAAELAADRRRQVLDELLILATQNGNLAAAPYRLLFDDTRLSERSGYRERLREQDRLRRVPDPDGSGETTLLELLAGPLRAAPDNLAGQLSFAIRRWGSILPSRLLQRVGIAIAAARHEFHRPAGGPGATERPGLVPGSTTGGGEEQAPEAFSPDAGWMEQVVMIAKSTLVWLDQLSRRYGEPVDRLDQIPDAELAALAEGGFNTLWLIGLWERSPASRRLKQMRGNPEAAASAYALVGYRIAEGLGGEEAFARLRERCRQHGLRLAGDVVPNHTGIDSHWVKDHPEWYIQGDHPPFPGYRFNGPDLSTDPEIGLYVEDGYYDNSDAAVVFRHLDRRSGRERYIYHGNDGTHMPWNDTAQLDYLREDVREAMIQTILAVARRFPVIRFDAAMTLTKKHFQRLWYPRPGEENCVPSRHAAGLDKADFDRHFPVEFWRQVVDRIAAEAPDTLLLAEAFWLMEGYFVRSLGMHRVYNSAFMNMLKREENAAFRSLLKETLAFNPQILKRFVNFMNNPDEATAVEQFGKGDKYFGVAVLLATLPGLPMFGHGQLEGLTEKYGMEYRRAYRDEQVDAGFFDHHHRQIFPLLRRRPIFSGIENFQLFDLHDGRSINEQVLAFSNGVADERVLVLYHNHHGEATGRIGLSVPKRQHGEDRPAVRTTLLGALALPEGTRRLVRYRDHRTGLWHLASLHEWEQTGLRVSLGPYAYAVLGDFSLVPEESGWQRLWRELDGRGVADLEEARRNLTADLQTDRRGGPLKILLVSSEVAPLAKTGGLADVAGSLPRALAELGHEVAIVMPYYRQVVDRSGQPTPLEISFTVTGGEPRSCNIYQTRIGKVTTWLIDQPDYFDRAELYGTATADYPDNAERFGFFCRAVLQALPRLGFQPDVIHVNDWQSALVPVLLKTEHADDPFYATTGSLLTIHNLGYQGIFPADTLARLGLPEGLRHPERLEFWGNISLLKGGIVFADRVNTVSPSYAREILRPEQGVGFDGILRARGADFSGILNGIDTADWDPAGDAALAARYRAGNLRGKATCKTALQKELGLAVEPGTLLIAMVTRLDPQKGIDLVEAGWEQLLERPVQFVLLGSGRQEYMERFAARAAANPDRIAVRLGFDDGLARRIYAGSDLFLMPSRYEPCGLGQLIALRYGSVPLVRATGGLIDTVTDIDADAGNGIGFRFAEPSAHAMIAALDRALGRFGRRRSWLELARRGMQADYSWRRSATDYAALYRQCQRP